MTDTMRFRLLAALCAAAAGFLFSLGLGGDFLLDDQPTITLNPFVQIDTLDAATLMGAATSFQDGHGWRAIPMASFALDYWRAGLDPTAFKTTNLLIHALTVLALAGMLRRLLSLAGWPGRLSTWAAPAMALAWAVHPLQVSSVLYIVQRMQTMATLFVVLALWAYLCARQAQVEGRDSRRPWALAVLCGLLALACKEDAVLLPAYALALELLVLRFRAQAPSTTRLLRRGYLLGTVAVLALYCFVVVPHYWSWEPLPFRDFSTPDRLLTQARVLAMYLGQSVFPWPDLMPFFYDGLQPSRGWLQPPSTLACFLLLSALAVAAWLCRRHRPLFALGIAWFFLGHAVTSNVIPLELAFEHRNHFPLVGIVLAVGDLVAAATTRWRAGAWATGTSVAMLLSALSFGSTMRLEVWSRDLLGFAQASTRLAPDSERAWAMLCELHDERSQDDTTSPDFARALEACEVGARRTQGLTLMANLVALKSRQGTISSTDWDLLFARAQSASMSVANRNAVWYLVQKAQMHESIDRHHLVRFVDIVSSRTRLDPFRLARFGFFLARDETMQADARRYFIKAAEVLPPDSPLLAQLAADLEASGHPDWAQDVREAAARGQRGGMPAD